MPRRLSLALIVALIAALFTPIAVASSASAAGDPANGAGYLKVSLKLSPTGDVIVKWKSPVSKKFAKTYIKKYVVTISTSRTLTSDVKKYKVAKNKYRAVVKPAALVTPASGDYTFVKVTVYRNGTGTGSSPTKWIKAPVVTPTPAASHLVMGTFNVRSWSVEKNASEANSWRDRRERVASTIATSGADIVALQEAGGSTQDPDYGGLWQYQDLLRLLPSNWALANDQPYRPNLTDRDNVYGKQGTRIIYNAQKYALLDQGYFELAGVEPEKSTAWTGWAHFQDIASGITFYVVSAHQQTGTSAADYNARTRQTTAVIDFVKSKTASGEKAFVAGDMNSTIYSKPDNGVHKQFVSAGFYDSFATANVTNGQYPTTNDYEFPVLPSPHRRDYILSYGGTTTGSYWYKNLSYTTGANVVSDHFMQVAELPLG